MSYMLVFEPTGPGYQTSIQVTIDSEIKAFDSQKIKNRIKNSPNDLRLGVIEKSDMAFNKTDKVIEVKIFTDDFNPKKVLNVNNSLPYILPNKMKTYTDLNDVNSFLEILQNQGYIQPNGKFSRLKNTLNLIGED